jgi:dTDP-4-dehydro-6-deoxy-alpha-D-gulose 4-ketoreductase
MNPDFWKEKSVLVTGADGFVGSHFVEQLSFLDAGVVGTALNKDTVDPGIVRIAEIEEIDLLNVDRLREMCQEHSIEMILHCAALDGNSEFKVKNSARIMDENMRMVSNILNTAKASGVSDVMIMSSAEIYSPQAKSPIPEEDDYQKFFQPSENGYVLSKIFSEILAKLYARCFGLRIYLPRPTNIYGPRDRFDDGFNRVIPSMIRKVINGRELEIWGDGSQIRGFIYVTDLVRSILMMIEVGKYTALNIATEESISILDLAKLVSESVGAKPDNIRLDPGKPGGMKERVLDPKKLLSIIDFRPMALERGIRETVSWYGRVSKDLQ